MSRSFVSKDVTILTRPGRSSAYQFRFGFLMFSMLARKSLSDFINYRVRFGWVPSGFGLDWIHEIGQKYIVQTSKIDKKKLKYKIYSQI